MAVRVEVDRDELIRRLGPHLPARLIGDVFEITPQRVNQILREKGNGVGRGKGVKRKARKTTAKR